MNVHSVRASTRLVELTVTPPHWNSLSMPSCTNVSDSALEQNATGNPQKLCDLGNVAWAKPWHCTNFAVSDQCVTSKCVDCVERLRALLVAFSFHLVPAAVKYQSVILQVIFTICFNIYYSTLRFDIYYGTLSVCARTSRLSTE